MLETNIDDMNSEIYGYVMEKAFKKGALDVFFTSIMMKKNRPGILLSVLCEEKNREELEKMIFQETTTLGLRGYAVDRRILKRKKIKINTKYGIVPIKVGFLEDKIIKYAPEYDFCREIAIHSELPIKNVYEEINNAVREYLQQKHLL